MTNRESLPGYYDCHADPENKYPTVYHFPTLDPPYEKPLNHLLVDPFADRPAFVVTLSGLYDYVEKEIDKIYQDFEEATYDCGAWLTINYDPAYHFPVSWKFTTYSIGKYTDTFTEYTSMVTTNGHSLQIQEFQPLD
jgi:hypothetical protein